MKKILLLGICVFVIDLVSKIFVCNTLSLNHSFCIIKNFFYLTYTNNYGAAFSILQNNRLFLVVAALLILCFILYYIKKNVIESRLEIICYSLIIGGLCGNLFDRIVYGYVIDFFDFYIFDYDFAIFNVADSAIVLGMFILLIITCRRGDKDENSSR